MSVWRLSLFAFADVVSTALLLVIVAALLELRRRAHSVVLRGVALGICTAALITSPVLFDLLTRRQLQEAASHGTYITPSEMHFFLPAIASLTVLALAAMLFPRSDARPGVALWRCAFVGVMFAFAVANLANWCSPGWCIWLGFPFKYMWWSDAMLSINGVDTNAGRSDLALAANVMIGLMGAGAMSAAYRRGARENKRGGRSRLSRDDHFDVAS